MAIKVAGTLVQPLIGRHRTARACFFGRHDLYRAPVRCAKMPRRRWASGGGLVDTVSGASETCLIVDAIWAGDVPSAVCGPTSAVEARGLAMTREDALGQPVVVALAPTGNASVTVTNSDGTSEAVAVTNSVYEVTQGDPASVKLKNAAGETTTRRLPALSVVPASAPAL